LLAVGEDARDEQLCHFVIHVLKGLVPLIRGGGLDGYRVRLRALVLFALFIREDFEVDKRSIFESGSRCKTFDRLPFALVSKDWVLLFWVVRLKEVYKIDLDALIGAVVVDTAVLHYFMQDSPDWILILVLR